MAVIAQERASGSALAHPGSAPNQQQALGHVAGKLSVVPYGMPNNMTLYEGRMHNELAANLAGRCHIGAP